MEYYDSIAPGYVELHKEEQLPKMRIIEEHLGYQSTHKLLDVGCGTGISSEVFHCHITGVDPSKEMLKEANRARDIEYVRGRAENLPFRDRTFDAVICVTSLHNFQNPESGLREMARVGRGTGAISIIKKSQHAEKLSEMVKGFFQIDKEIAEDKDIIFFFGLDKI